MFQTTGQASLIAILISLFCRRTKRNEMYVSSSSERQGPLQLLDANATLFPPCLLMDPMKSLSSGESQLYVQ